MKNWRDITVLQKHWIGNCNGTRFEFELEDISSGVRSRILPIFTHNPEHVTSASFISVPQGSFLDQMYQESKSSHDSSEKFRKLPVRAINPFTGNLLPVYVTDEIEYSVGADCHLGIPEIDRHFATIANIPIISPPEEDEKEVNSVENVSVVRERISQIAQQRGIGGFPCSPKLRDWLISCRCYWGTPIPIVYCTVCGPQPVPYSELPVVLPKIDKLSSHGKSPLSEATDWINTKCPK